MKLPLKSTLFSNHERDKDLRGSILSIVDSKINNVSIITCNKNTIRSNHYHKMDYHYMYVLEGEINYFFKKLDNEEFYYMKVERGQTIFTPNKEIHATHFPVKTSLIVSSRFPRDQITYEKDTVRVNFVNQENLVYMIENGIKC